MIPLSPDRIARITHSRMVGTVRVTIHSVCTDTRRATHASESLFVALRGPNHDGHRYLEEACQLGFRCFLAKQVPQLLSGRDDLLFLIHDNPLQALQELASWHRDQFRGTLIAIAGSNGKTIIKEWLAQILQGFYPISKSPKSYNSQLGVPLSVLGIQKDAQYAVMEAGISQPGEMASLQKILHPDIGLFSNIGDAHQEHFSGMDEKIREKISLFREARKIVYCQDHGPVDEAFRSAGYPGIRLTWSRKQQATLRIQSERTERGRHYLQALYEGKEIGLILPFTDPASIENLIHIWLLILSEGLDPVLCQELILNLEPIRMRLDQKQGINGCTLINDYYNSDIVSFRTALDLLYQQTAQQKKTIIFSDILQTGMPEKQLFSEISQLIRQRPVYRLIGIGAALSRQKDQFGPDIRIWDSTTAFIADMDPDEFRDEAILLKGARSFQFEQISRLLEAKVHSTTLEIRMDDVRHNLTQFRQQLHPGTGIMVMVKAFTYGSGGVAMARFLENERVDYLGVAFADEGLEIRRAGIRTPIMVMNPDFRQSDILIDNRLEPEVFSWTGLRSYAIAARQQGNSAFPVHLKIDTGMHRLGFGPEEVAGLTEWLRRHPELQIKSIFSHLAASEDPGSDDFTRRQIKRFDECCRMLELETKAPFLRHILNSAGILRFPEAQYEMVRLGIGLHGYSEHPDLNLKPVATLKTTISQIHDLGTGEYVGYGHLARLNRPSRIAVIPIGYADGIDRRLGNGCYFVLIRGNRYPTIGSICMDMTLLDITGCDAAEGEEVIIFGPDLPVTAISQALGTIPYEVLTSIPGRVKRIYLFD